MILPRSDSSLRMMRVVLSDDAWHPLGAYRVRMRLLVSRTQRWDVVLAAGIVALCEVQFATGTGQNQLQGPTWLGIASGLALGLPLMWRTSHPRAVLLVVFANALALSLLGLSQPKQGYIGEIVAGLVVLYTVARQAELRTALAGLAYACVVVLLVSVHESLFNDLGSLLILGAAVVIGRVLQARRQLIEQLRTTAHALELSRDENARAAVAAERVSIARELHDVVAHAVSIMVVQAGAAEQVLEADPARARQPMIAVQESGREALTELRRLLGMLRPDPSAASTMVPQPGLAELERLAGSIRDAGLSIDLCCKGEPRALPHGLDLAAFRIVQEALTNVLKHADAAVAQVTVRYDNDAIEVEVLDDGRGASDEPSNGRHGLVGMQERATIYGGEFHAGPRKTGGYAVRARLPTPADQ